MPSNGINNSRIGVFPIYGFPPVTEPYGSISRQGNGNRNTNTHFHGLTRAPNFRHDILCSDPHSTPYLSAENTNEQRTPTVARSERSLPAAQSRSNLGHGQTPSTTELPSSVPSCKMATAHVDVFQKLVVGNKNIIVDPNQCISFCKVRRLSDSGVRRLMNIFRGVEVPGSTFLGFCSSGNIPTVIELCDELEDNPTHYFMNEKGLTLQEAESEKSKFPKWFGIIDGAHRNEALRRLSLQYPAQFAGFRWTVQLLTNGTITELRAFARNFNEKQGETFYVQSTLYDTISSLQEDIQELKKRNGRMPSASQLSKFYTGGRTEAGGNSLYNLARIAISVSPAVVHHPGIILNEEDPEEAARREDVPADRIDCRLYRNLVTPNTLLKSTAWMRAKGPEAEQNQVAALYRLRNNAAVNQFKRAKPGLIDDYYLGAVYATIEIAKFTRLLDGMPWTSSMITLRDNMLHKTILDSKLKLNRDNSSTIFAPLMQAFVRCCPQVGPQKLLKWQTGDRNPTPSSPCNSPRQNTGLLLDSACSTSSSEQAALSTSANAEQTQVSPSGSDNITANSISAQPFCPDIDSGARRRDDLLQSRISDLQSIGVTAVNLEWSVYESEVMTADESHSFHMVLTEPPDDIDGAHITEFVLFAHRALKPGGSLFIFISWTRYCDWIPVLRDQNFRIMKHPFVFIPDSSNIQKTRSTDFPQGAAFFGIACTAPGKSPTDFAVNLSSPYINTSCSHLRKFAIMDNCPFPSPRLMRPGTKRPYILNERSPLILSDLLQTFSPPGGSVVDPFAGTLSLGAAAVMAGRKCTLIDADADMFPIAIDRLAHITSLRDMLPMHTGAQLDCRNTDQMIFKTFISRLPDKSSCTGTCSDSETDLVATESTDLDCKPAPEKKRRLSLKRGLKPSDLVENSHSTNRYSHSLSQGISPSSEDITTNDFKCRVVGCLREKEGEPNSATGHRCAACNLPVHLICCQRVLNITVYDSTTSLLCTACVG